VLSQSNKVVIDNSKGSGVVPYLPLPEIQQRRGQPAAPAQPSTGASQQ
jgi:membrane protease subunit HflK